MQFPLLIVSEVDGRLAALLRPLAESQRWQFRGPQREEAIWKDLPRGRPAVLVLRVGPNLEREFAILGRVTRIFPEVAVVAVLEADQPRWAGLAWDLGAAYVLSSERGVDELLGLMTHLMNYPAGRSDATAAAT